jgi:carboxylesterase type B
MDFHGHYFMDEDVVVVSLNYRLQAFGKLGLGLR